MDTSDWNAKSHMENVFIAYHSILRRDGLSWVLTTNQKIIVSHALSVIRSLGLQSCIKLDLNFSQDKLTDGFRGSMRQDVRLSEAF